MNPLTVAIGVAVLLFGAYTAVNRIRRPHKLAKLAALQELFGEKTGGLIHLLAYCIVPLLAGAMFIYSGVKGAPLF